MVLKACQIEVTEIFQAKETHYRTYTCCMEQIILSISWDSVVMMWCDLVWSYHFYVFVHPWTLKLGLIPVRPTTCVIRDRSCWEMRFCGASLYTWVRYVYMLSCTYRMYTLVCTSSQEEGCVYSTGVLSGWPRDRLVITSVSLSGPVCPPTAGLTYLINIDRPLVCIQTHTHTHTHTRTAFMLTDSNSHGHAQR